MLQRSPERQLKATVSESRMQACLQETEVTLGLAPGSAVPCPAKLQLHFPERGRCIRPVRQHRAMWCDPVSSGALSFKRPKPDVPQMSLGSLYPPLFPHVDAAFWA